jgi:hypothetical protein
MEKGPNSSRKKYEHYFYYLTAIALLPVCYLVSLVSERLALAIGLGAALLTYVGWMKFLDNTPKK